VINSLPLEEILQKIISKCNYCENFVLKNGPKEKISSFQLCLSYKRQNLPVVAEDGGNTFVRNVSIYPHVHAVLTEKSNKDNT
jgi:hypothetical protein